MPLCVNDNTITAVIGKAGPDLTPPLFLCCVISVYSQDPEADSMLSPTVQCRIWMIFDRELRVLLLYVVLCCRSRSKHQMLMSSPSVNF